MAIVTLKDIARELDVSVSLVSKVINGRLNTTRLRPQLQAAILKKAEELGFRPNLSSQTLRHGRHNVIGVFLHNLGMRGSGIIEELQGGLHSEALKHRQRLLLSFFENAEEFEAIANATQLGAVDGLIIAGVSHPELTARLMRIRRSGLPIVTALTSVLDPSLPNVGVSQEEASRLATQHLIDRRCRHIAHIVASDRERYTGYLSALRANDIPINKNRIYEAGANGYSDTAGKLAIQSFIANHVEFDGLVTQSDHQAAGALNALLDAGRRVPQDVRLIGIDNAPFCDLTRVPLSSVSQNLRQLGHLAITTILKAINGGPVASVNVPPSLFIRESTR